MHKFLIIISSFFYLSQVNIQAQSFYISKDFERKGVTEYLKIMWGKQVFYWTSNRKKEIALVSQPEKIAEDVSDGRLYAVSFPNRKKIYRFHEITQGKQQLICTHPDGQVQVFNPLPVVYFSKNFEKPGITEYLSYNTKSNTYWYYTSKNKHRKIKLIGVGESQGLYKFPGGNTVYKLSLAGAYGGRIRCIHPDGRTQYFEFYEWKN